MQITKALIVRTETSADRITLLTNLPSGEWPYSAAQEFSMRCAHGMGETYLSTNFPGVPITIITDDGKPRVKLHCIEKVEYAAVHSRKSAAHIAALYYELSDTQEEELARVGTLVLNGGTRTLVISDNS